MSSDEGLQRRIEQFNQGDSAALWTLLEELESRLRAHAATILHKSFSSLAYGGPQVRTSDLVADLRVRLATGLQPGQINDVDHLFRIAARNARWILLDEARRQAAQQCAKSETVPPIPWQRFKDAVEAVQACAADLPENQRQVFDRCLFMTQAEVAAELGLTAGSVRGLWQRARHSVRRCMLNKGFGDLDLEASPDQDAPMDHEDCPKP